jgi:hypothetical protein
MSAVSIRELLSLQKFISIEVKTTPRNYSVEQLKHLQSLKINIVEHWIVAPKKSPIASLLSRVFYHTHSRQLQLRHIFFALLKQGEMSLSQRLKIGLKLHSN